MPYQCDCPVTLPGPSLAGSCGTGSLFFMNLLELFLRSQCDIQDSCGQIPSLEVPGEEYDFIVVGGGSAGCVVTNRLSEVLDWKVLLVEAGVNEPLDAQVPSMCWNTQGTSVDWQFKTEPEEMACLGYPDKRCPWPRGKVIGGTSVLNGLFYVRGSRHDFDGWESQGNTDWGYDKVLPYFMKSEDNLQADKLDKTYHGIGGYQPISQFPYHPPLAEDILQGAQELGHRVGDLNGEHTSGFAIGQTTSKNGIRYSSSRAFLRPIKNRPNLHFMLNTTVTRVLVEPDEKRAYGIEVVKADGTKYKILSKKEVILCGGSVNSPQILLLSGIGPKDDLASVGVPVVHNLPGVGKNLHNHVSYFVPFTINEISTPDLNWNSTMQYINSRNGPLSGTGLSQVTGLMTSKFGDSAKDHPDLQIFFNGYLANCPSEGFPGMPTEGESPKTKRRVSITPTATHIKSRGYLTLADSNPLSHPKIYGKYLTDPADVATLIDGIKFALELSKTEALQKYGYELIQTPVPGCELKPFGSDEYWECAIRIQTYPENHQAGSCKMGPASDPDAVVDPELQVHGVKCLRVIDASIMPTVTSGNTNAPTLMIGEKGSDMVKRKWLV